MKDAKENIMNAQALARVEEADAVYTETDKSGNKRTVYMDTDGSGSAVILASEHKMANGTKRLLTYEHKIKSGKNWEQGVLTKGKIYESGKNGKYGEQASGIFKIQEIVTGMAQGMDAKLEKAFGLGANARVIYSETMIDGRARSVSTDKETGKLNYVYTKDKDGNENIVTFGVKPTKDGIQSNASIVDFNKLDKKEQNEILASLPVMGDKDASLITAKLVGMQNDIMQQKIAKMAQANGWKFDTETSQLFINLPLAILDVALDDKPGSGTEGSLPEFGEGAQNDVILEGSDRGSRPMLISFSSTN